MAITVETNTPDIVSGTHNQLIVPDQSVSPGASAIFALITAQTGTNRSITSCTWNGNILQPIGTYHSSDAARNSCYIYGLLEPVTGGPAPLEVNFINNVNRSCASLIGVFGGSETELWENNFVGNDGALEGSNQPIVRVTPATANALVISCMQHRNSQPGVGPTWNLIYKEVVTGDDHGAQWNIQPTATEVDHDWTPASYGNAQWASAGCSYAEAIVEDPARYWVGGSGNWSNPANWSATSGGAGGASVPDANDPVVVDGASGSGSYTITIDQDSQCLEFNSQLASDNLTIALDGTRLDCTIEFLMKLTGAQTLSHAAGSELHIGGDFDQQNVVPIGGGGDLYLEGTGEWKYNANSAVSATWRKGYMCNANDTITIVPQNVDQGHDPDFTYGIEFLGDEDLGSGTLAVDLREHTGTALFPALEIQHVFNTPQLCGIYAGDLGLGTARLNLAGFAIEMENFSGGAVRLFNTLDHEVNGLGVLDLTGANHPSPLRRWDASGPLLLADDTLISIEKGTHLHLQGRPLNCGNIQWDGTGDSLVEFGDGGTVSTVHNEIRIRGNSAQTTNAKLDIGESTVDTPQLRFSRSGRITMSPAGSLTVTGATVGQGTVRYVDGTLGSDANGGTDPITDAVATFARGVEVLVEGGTLSFAGDHAYDVPDQTTIPVNSAEIGKTSGTEDPIFRLDDRAELILSDADGDVVFHECKFAGASSTGTYCNFTPSRTSGVAPLWVHFDAVTFPGSRGEDQTYPFGKQDAARQLKYEWDFDDLGSPHNSDLNHMAAHCFESPGTYTVRCTVTDRAGNSAFHEETITVTAGAWDDRHIANGGNNGGAGSAGDPWADWDFALAWLDGGANRRLLVNRDDTFPTSETTGRDFTGPVQIQPYGTGADPVIQNTTPNQSSGLAIGNSDDLRVIDINFQGPGDVAGADGVGIFFPVGDPDAPDVATNTLALRCRFEGWRVGVQNTGNREMTLSGFFDCVYTQNLVYGTRMNYGDRCAWQDNQFLDATIEGNQVDPVEHTMRHNMSRSLMKYNTFVGGFSPRNVIKMRGWSVLNDVRPTITNEYNVIAWNSFLLDGTDTCDQIVQAGPLDDDHKHNVVDNVLIEGNQMQLLHESTGNLRPIMVTSRDGTMRNNAIRIRQVGHSTNGCFGGLRHPTDDKNEVPTNIEIVGNSIYNDLANPNSFTGVELREGDNHRAENNLVGWVDGVSDPTAISNTSGALTAKNGLLNGTAEVAGCWEDAANDDFNLIPGAQARVEAEPVPATPQTAVIDGGDQTRGLALDYLQRQRDALPDIGAAEFQDVPPTAKPWLYKSPTKIIG